MLVSVSDGLPLPETSWPISSSVQRSDGVVCMMGPIRQARMLPGLGWLDFASETAVTRGDSSNSVGWTTPGEHFCAAGAPIELMSPRVAAYDQRAIALLP